MMWVWQTMAEWDPSGERGRGVVLKLGWLQLIVCKPIAQGGKSCGAWVQADPSSWLSSWVTG